MGVDPGSTVGVAAFDFEGKPVRVFSIKQAGLDIIVGKISQHGKPVVFASDVYPVPETVKQLASKFNAVVNRLGENLSVEEKKQLCQRSRISFSNQHEKDAYAAAAKAFSLLSSKIRAVKHRYEESGGENKKNFEETLELVLKGKSLQKALRPKTAPQKPKVVKKNATDYAKIVKNLNEKKKNLEHRISVLEKSLSSARRQASLKTEKKWEHDKEVEEKNKKISSLSKRVSQLLEEQKKQKKYFGSLLEKLGDKKLVLIVPSSREKVLTNNSAFPKNASEFEKIYACGEKTMQKLDAKKIPYVALRECHEFGKAYLVAFEEKQALSHESLVSIVEKYRKQKGI